LHGRPDPGARPPPPGGGERLSAGCQDRPRGQEADQREPRHRHQGRPGTARQRQPQAAPQRAISVVNFVNGKVSRWVDYWDANRIGAANLEGFKQPEDNFPADFGESLVGEAASDRIKQAAANLNRALTAHEVAGAAALFAPDATFTDLTAHVRVAGPHDITSFLDKAQGTLPYLGHGVEVRHVVGSDAGGGYEWTAKGVVPRCVNVLKLGDQGLITSFESVWDGSRVDDDALLGLAKAAIQR